MTSAFVANPDPMRPAEFVSPLGQTPPACPVCKMLLNQVDSNPDGDLLFECLGDGYEAVLRVRSGEWEPRPGRHIKRWAPPIKVG